MKIKGTKIFSNLKVELGEYFAQKGEVSTPIIQDWKGKEIFNFQESLVEKTGGRISEKWFYTHIKNESDKLPRIDMLNILAQFLDYNDWYDYQKQFINTPTYKPKTQLDTVVKPNIETPKEQPVKGKKPTLLTAIAGLMFAAVALAFTWNWMNVDNENVKFCFLDMDRKTIITQPIQIEMLKDNESSVFYKSDANGCISIAKTEKQIKFIVRSPYYEADTVLRIVKDGKCEESIPLRTNDYALMIHYFSISDVENWKRRREQLLEMIHDDAIIYQIYNKAKVGMDMLNKTEFIDKLTMPVNSLRNIEIIETEYKNNQIMSLRFIQKTKS